MQNTSKAGSRAVPMARQAVRAVKLTDRVMSEETYMGLVALDELAHHMNATSYTNAAYQAEQ